MASALMTNSNINALQHHSNFPLSHLKLIPKAGHVPKSSFQPPIISKNMTIKSKNYNNNRLPELQIDEYMTLKASKIHKALGEAVPLISQHPVQLLDEVERVRVCGTLCIASCELVGGNESSVMPLACAAEIFMTMVLNRTLLCHAIDHMATETQNVSPDRLLTAIGEISSAVGTRGILAGRIMDIRSKGIDLSLSELETIHRLKIGKFIEASVVCGALIGGANEEEIERLRKYGKFVGLAYQVWDDILNMARRRNNEAAGDIKTAYTQLMGVDGAKKYARELVAEANQELACFDSTRAAPLYHMANFVISRRN